MERIVSELVRYPWLAIRVAYSIEHSCQPITDEYFTRRVPLVYVEYQNFELERYIYIYTHDIRRDEKRVENLVGGNVATKARFLVHEINHTRVRVMDERRKRGNTSGSLKRS